MAKVLTYDIPDYKIKLKIRQLQVIDKKIQAKLITHAMNGTSVAKTKQQFFHPKTIFFKKIIILVT